MNNSLITRNKLPEDVLRSPLYANHYSFVNDQLATITNSNDYYSFIKFSNPQRNFIIGDSLICKYFNTDFHYMISYFIEEILDDLTVKVNLIDIAKYKNMRSSPRFSVSLMAVITLNDCIDFCCTTVNCVSKSGLRLCCKEKFTIGNPLNINLILNNSESVNIKGSIVRYNKLSTYFEYGIHITLIKPEHNNTYFKYINDLQRKEYDFAKKSYFNGFQCPEE